MKFLELIFFQFCMGKTFLRFSTKTMNSEENKKRKKTTFEPHIENMVKLYAPRCCGGNGIWDIPLSAISHFSLWQIFFGISHFPAISQFQVHSRCGELKLGYPKIPKYDNIVVVAKKNWDIPHIPDRPNIPKNNVLLLWQKKLGYPGCVPISRNYFFRRWIILRWFPTGSKFDSLFAYILYLLLPRR